MEHLIEDIKFVECNICKKKFSKLDNRHLKTHKLKLKEYRNQFPNSPTKTKERYIKDLADNRKRQQAKKEKEKMGVTKKCWNFKNCGNEVTNVNINVAGIWISCQNCKDFGLIHPEAKKILEKQNKGFKDKYNQNNPSNVKEIVSKRKETVKKNKEIDPDYYNKIVSKRVKTIIKTYGFNWKEILHEMTEEGMFKKYGIRHALENDKFIEKAMNTLYKRKHVLNAMFDDDYKEKCLTSRNENNNPEDIKKKTLQTNYKKYGGPSPTCDPTIVEKAKITRLNNQIEKIILHLKEFGYEMDDKYTDAHSKYNFKHSCGYTIKVSWNYLWNQIQGGIICSHCSPKKTKTKYVTQEYIAKFIENLGITVITGNRTIIKPYELDIILPDQKIAIEYCGLFHHCEEVIKNTRKRIDDPRKYHLMKKEKCKKAGYNTLITIFEDEWIHKKDIVKERLKHIIGKSESKRIHGRKCKIFIISSIVKNKFLNKFHIQGGDSAKILYGAFYEDELVAVMTFSYGNISKGNKKKEGVWELNRFCSDYNYHIPGIAGKLLKEFQRKNEWKEIFSFADQRWSNGNLYYKLGFNIDHINPPSYSYIDYKNIKRIHRFAMRKQSHEPKDIPEWILRLKQGYKRIWDCGTLKFILKNDINQIL